MQIHASQTRPDEDGERLTRAQGRSHAAATPTVRVTDEPESPAQRTPPVPRPPVAA